MNLFRARALAHGVDPDAYVAPPEGEAIYERIEVIDDFDELVAYAAGSLDHFGQLLDAYAAGADGRGRGDDRDRRRRQRRSRGSASPRSCRSRTAPPSTRTSSTGCASSSRPGCMSAEARRRPPLRGAARRAAAQLAARVALRRAVARLAGGRLRVGGHADRPSPRLRLRPVHGARLRRPRRRAHARSGRRLDRRLLDRADLPGLPRHPRPRRGGGARGDRRRRRRAPSSPTSPPGPSPYLLHALRSATRRERGALRHRRRRARAGVRGRPRARRRSDRVTTRRASAFDRAALAALRPRPDVVCELGLYGIYHDDALIERHFLDLAETVAPAPDRLQRAGRQPRDRVHRAGLAQRRGRALRLAAAPAGADRGIRARGRVRARRR